MTHRTILKLVAASIAVFAALPAHAIILHKSATRNTSAPGGAYLNSGWQYQLPVGGVPIGPKTLVAANHTGIGVGTNFTWNSISYQVTAETVISGTDISICTVNNTFPTIVPLYNPATDGSLNGKTMVLFGRGKQRGAELHLPSAPRPGESTLRGWQWGATDNVLSWGTNTVEYTLNHASYGNLIVSDFDAAGTSDEGTIAAGDSGGGVYVQGAGGVWKLAGLNYLVEASYRLTAGGSNIEAAVFDKGNLWNEVSGGVWQQVSDTPSNIPSLAYASNVSNYLNSFTTYRPKAGDATLDGKVNTMDFNVLAANFGQASAGQWIKGDFNSDGTVNSTDFNLLQSNFGFGASAAEILAPGGVAAGSVVPEPASLGLLGLLLTALFPRRRSPAHI